MLPRRPSFHVDQAGALTDSPAEIIAADLRPGGDGRRLARLKLIAGMLGLELDEIVRRDAHRRGQQLSAVSAASVGLAVVMGVLALSAIRSRDEARVQRGHADGFIEFMLGDLNRRLRPSGQLDILDSIAAKAISYYDIQSKTGLDADELGQRARVLHLLGDISDKRGDLTRAGRYFQQASDSTRELISREPRNPRRLLEHAQSLFWEGYIAQRRGDENGAEAQFRGYRQLTEELVRRDPNNDIWSSEAADANLDLGTVYLSRGQAGAAKAAFSRALDVNERLSAKSPADRDRVVKVIGSYAWRADAEAQRGNFDAALRDRLAERAKCDALLQERPGDDEVSGDLVVDRMAIANILIKQGKTAAARRELEPAIELSDRLMAGDPGNTTHKEHAASALIMISQANLRDHLIEAAADAAGRGERLAEGLARQDSTVVFWNGALLGEARIATIRVAAERSRRPSDLRDALAPAEKEADRLARLVASHPADFPLAEVAAEASLLKGDLDELSGRQGEAHAAWTATKTLLERLRTAQPNRFSHRDNRLLAEALAKSNGQLPSATRARGRQGKPPILRLMPNSVKVDYAW